MHNLSFPNLISRLVFLFTAFSLILSGCVSHTPPADPDFQIRVLKIGKADASLLYTEGSSQAVLIDAGEEEDGKEIAENLEELGITEISHLVVTHYDKDHMGGVPYILEHCSVKQIIQPDYPGHSKHYEPYQEAVSAHGDVLSVSEPLTITAGALTLEIYPENDPQNQFFEADDDNNRSLVTMVSCQGQRFLFTGDIKEERIRLLLQSDVTLSCDWIKMPHHGSWNEALPELLEAASPRFAVICCSDKNPADPETLELLEEMGISCWLTSDGDVTFFCSGEDIYGLQR